MKFCANCGASIPDEVQFCPNCGAGYNTPAPAPIPVPAPVPKPKKARKGKHGLAWTAVIAVYLILAIVVSCSFGLFDGVIDLFDSDSGSGSTLRDKDNDDDDRDPANTTAPEDPEDPEDPWQPEDPEVPEDSEEPEEPENPVYTIKVWADYNDQNEYNNWLEEMQQRFENNHPEYEIVWENETVSPGDVAYNIISDVTSAADVFLFPSDQLNKMISAGGVSRVVGEYQNQLLNDNNDVAIGSVTHTDGYQYAFPIANNTWYLYYDKTVFTEDDVKNLDTMLERGRVYLPLANGWTGGCFFLGTGGTLFGENGLDAAAGVNFGGENGYKAARKMVELKNNPNVTLGDLDIFKFINGDVDATFSGSWVYGDLEAALGDRLGVAMLPKFTMDSEEYQMTAMSSTRCVGINPYTGRTEGKQQVCVEFAAFLASEEAQLARYDMCGVIPAHQDLRDHWMIQNDPLAVAEMDTMAYASVVHPILSAMDYYWGPIGDFCGKLRDGYITLDNYDLYVDEMMDSFSEWW